MKKLIVFLLLLAWAPTGLHADELVDRKTFFEHVMGMPESAFQADDNAKKQAISQDAKGVFYLKNQATGQQFRAGNFETHSIADLRKETEAMQKPDKGTFNVIEALKPVAPYYKHVEIGANQADPNNNDAVFQVASNFNALELTGVNDDMANLASYFWDRTQGPFASMSAAPGLILRHYYMFHNKLTDPSTWQQYPVLGRLWQKSDQNKQINLLENTDIPIQNSYVNFAKRAPQDVRNFDPANMQIAWHGDIQVTSGLMPDVGQHTQIDRADQFVNQVFTAAVAFDNTNPVEQYLQEPAVFALVEPIAQAVLDAAYEGTIRAAALHGKKKVFLSRIGLGAFNNKPEWVANALDKMKNFIEQSGLEVTLIIFDGNVPADGATKFRERMLKLTEQTGGTYTQYSKASPEGLILTSKELAEKPADKEKAPPIKEAASPIIDAPLIIADQLADIPANIIQLVDLNEEDMDKKFNSIADILYNNNIRFKSEYKALMTMAGIAGSRAYLRSININYKALVQKLIYRPSDDSKPASDKALINALNNLTSALTDMTDAIK